MVAEVRERIRQHEREEAERMRADLEESCGWQASELDTDREGSDDEDC